VLHAGEWRAGRVVVLGPDGLKAVSLLRGVKRQYVFLWPRHPRRLFLWPGYLKPPLRSTG